MFVLSGFAPESKVVYCDYGFDLERLKGRRRRRLANEPFTFAYIGTHKARREVVPDFFLACCDKKDLHTHIQIDLNSCITLSICQIRILANFQNSCEVPFQCRLHRP